MPIDNSVSRAVCNTLLSCEGTKVLSPSTLLVVVQSLEEMQGKTKEECIERLCYALNQLSTPDGKMDALEKIKGGQSVSTCVVKPCNFDDWPGFRLTALGIRQCTILLKGER